MGSRRGARVDSGHAPGYRGWQGSVAATAAAAAAAVAAQLCLNTEYPKFRSPKIWGLGPRAMADVSHMQGPAPEPGLVHGPPPQKPNSAVLGTTYLHGRFNLIAAKCLQQLHWPFD
jgi:hypothetical protein